MAEKNKTRYDKHVTASELDNGDRVLVRSVRLRGKNKLADKWEETVYVVVDRYGDLPVYKVCPAFQTGPIQTQHRDLLLHCGTLSSDVSELETQSLVPRHKTRSKVTSGSPEEDTPDSEEQVYYSGSQFEVVGEFFTVHTPKVTKPGKEDITQSLGTGYGSATSESQVIETSPVNPEETSPVNPEETSPVNPEETSPVNPEENSPGNPGVQSEREEFVDISPTATLVAQDPSFNGEPCMPEPSSAGEELNVVENMETNTEAIELVHPQSELRRSFRTKEKPKILTYPKLENPLVTIFQSPSKIVPIRVVQHHTSM
ncbi:Retrovirus-related Pol polyprotein from transposon 412 [Labeo rohita]|uniref:Retrovirus-related Pol polyprotein from transposon 412 n=1 Tax=Labeo rohita TaxID=84645 RepID=A0A498MRS0_LABRO|nr:Retrovirus-related Pol polyprotein from transposon 412 [Labeo rohita]RXN24318.1 Retrovirus-related Pol polyprotein from transposon 412 [Labeo rohita]